jgi:hypothetical protein
MFHVFALNNIKYSSLWSNIINPTKNNETICFIEEENYICFREIEKGSPKG